MEPVTTTGIIDAMYAHLMNTGFVYDNNLNVHRRKFPKGSTGEFVVINTIGNQIIRTQVATVNVNIYVPDQKVTINGVAQRVSNETRLRALSEVAIKEVSTFSGRHFFDVTAEDVIEEEEIEYSFINIKCQFYNY
jgi:hypothetical protein